jgi:hypothetical protein
MRRLSPRYRKLALTTHVVVSVGWLGLQAVLVLLAVTGLTTGDDATLRAAYVVAGLLGTWFLIPVAGASLVSGVVLSLGTPWGLVRHRWVLIKLVINVVMLVVSTTVLSHALGEAADRARDGVAVGDLGVRVLIGPSAGLALLIVATALSVYRPKGRTRWDVSASAAPR